ncbi:uncharacterized protein LOC106172838 [Lingula anatina]|uniref:Uncharacterized protein LOC106172838 n=1 Tax=Lingula anatina TaxID=7574 RepID=A0A1S3JFL5_LINAN|nr:uncharacterized protein LOC106172838 [Lingula anatina]|eukprot:XP_013409200.1 uncharacterized protein LOC106172838 [Lingula anatina]
MDPDSEHHLTGKRSKLDFDIEIHDIGTCTRTCVDKPFPNQSERDSKSTACHRTEATSEIIHDDFIRRNNESQWGLANSGKIVEAELKEDLPTRYIDFQPQGEVFTEDSATALKTGNTFWGTESPHPNTPSPDYMTAFNDVLVTFMKEQNIPGLSLALGKDGEVVYTQGYGQGGRSKNVVPSSIFRIASISKTLTAVAALTLVEEGKLNLNGKVFGPKGILSRFSPAVRSDRRLLQITVRHLLQHSAGWDFDVIGDPMYYRHVGAILNEPEPVSPETLIKYMMTQKLQFTPGTKHSYCNFGYLVLGQVIEVASGVRYEDYLRQVLPKAGITSVRVGKTRKEDAFEDEVEYYAFPPNDTVDSVFPGEGRVSAPYGAFCLEDDAPVGGLVSTAEELIKFFYAIDGMGSVQLISQESFSLMLERPKFVKGKESWYGMGLEVMDSGKTWEHTGGMDGTTSTLTHDCSGFTWACLCNCWVNDTDLSSVIRYALSKVGSWSPYNTVIPGFRFADVISKDKLNMVKILVKENELSDMLQSVKELACYQATWIDGYMFENGLYFNVSWTRQRQVTQVLYNQTEVEILSLLEDISNSNLIPIHLDSYIKKDCVCFALISKETDPKENLIQEWKIHLNLETSSHAKIQEEYKKHNIYLQVCCVLNFNNVTSITTLYLRKINKTCDVWSKYDLTKDQYEKEFNRHARYGHLLAYVKAYQDGDRNKFSAIWTNPGPYIYSSSHHLSKYGLYVDLWSYAEKNFQVSCLSGYVSEDDYLSYVVAWKKPCKPGAVASNQL